MSFGDAFGYPYKSLAKIATIVLGFTILVAVLVSIAINSRDGSGLILLTAGTVIAQSLFLTGYGIRVIRHIMDGYDQSLPAIELIGDIGRGVVVSFAGLITFLPLIIFAFCGASMMIPSSSRYGASPEIGGSTILFIIIVIPFAVYLGWGFIVGMIRYANEEESGAMFQFGTNFGYVNSNIGASAGLFGHNLLLAIIYGITTTIISSVYNNTVTSSLTYRSDQNVIIAVLTVGYILSISLSLLQQFSGFHLIAQYAERIGINRFPDDEKMKY